MGRNADRRHRLQGSRNQQRAREEAPVQTVKFKPSRKAKANLSKNLMAMKFMQRTRQDNSDDSKDPTLALETASDDKYVIESSFEIIENLRLGRISFGGMNAEIQALQEAQENEEIEEVEDD